MRMKEMKSRDGVGSKSRRVVGRGLGDSRVVYEMRVSEWVEVHS